MGIRRSLLALGLAAAAVACSDDDDEAATTSAPPATDAATTAAAEPTTTGAASTSTAAPATTMSSATSAPVTAAPPSVPSGELSVVVAEYSDATRPYWEGVVADFEAQHPGVAVSLDVVSWEQINQLIDDRVQIGDPPDIVNIDAFAPYAADGLLRPAEDVLSADRFGDILPNFAANASIDGVQYALPLTGTVRALLYNLDLFTAAGITDPPATWDELRAAAQAITDLPGDEIGYAMPLGPEEAQAEAAIWMFGNGGGWVDGSGSYAIDSAANVEAFEYMGGLAAAGLTQPDPAATDHTDALDRFFAGQVGMIEALPQVVQFAADQPGLTVAATPPPTRTGEPATLGTADHVIVFANEGNTEAARALLDVVYATDNHVAFVGAEGFLPVTSSGIAASRATLPAEQAAFLDVLPAARFYPADDPAWTTVQSAVQVQIGQAIAGDAATVLGELQALAEAS